MKKEQLTQIIREEIQNVINEWKPTRHESTQFVKAPNAAEGDIFFSPRGNATAIKVGNALHLLYVWEGKAMLGKIQKSDSQWKHMGPATPNMLQDLQLKAVAGLITPESAKRDAATMWKYIKSNMAK